ncbi:MAG: non-homologous end-joining DNA ligase [Planctomycetes bacterium]|nr:non-homologous end-joining DNA ligase [Planctomycetota bacterium]
MLATLVEDYFSDSHWIFECKFDGWRCIVSSRAGKVTLWSRNHRDLSAVYPELVRTLSGQGDYVADGELVAMQGGVSSFQRLQQRAGVRVAAPDPTIAVELYLFDLPWCAGYDLTQVPLLARKKVLKQAVRFNKLAHYTNHLASEGEKYRDLACKAGWEGVIAKRADSTYVSARSTDWLKFKCVRRQELVIVGYTEPQGARSDFGALLLGYYDNKHLRYAGKVGTGFDQALLGDLGRKLARLERKSPAVTDPPRERGLHWVEPKLVGEIGFTEWTGEGRLRHPRFIALRTDKPAREIVRERAL